MIDIWGKSACIDCYDCDSGLIRSPQSVKKYVAELIALIDMRAFGPCHVVDFGDDPAVAGLSMFQLIETSNISGHFANATNTAYLDIFSCKHFDIDQAAQFSKDFFKAKAIRTQSQDRLKYYPDSHSK
ncbi:S-adenosylmethionine decarboxylase [Gammaproteobacteria bacterium]|nr:S-adenosylmethionine decarboxylase [Gammaproteobacteria bacterium]